MAKRYVNIDALRGIAALAVVLFHLFGGMKGFIASPTLTSFLPAFGYSGVYLFFVISGFCIHLRWAKQKVASNEEPVINFLQFWKRRWIRLYPAYLATLALYIVWRASQGQLDFGSFFYYDLTSHLLMLHNLDGRTVYSLNGVLWTLAIEEQLYLLYFLLLALRIRFGWGVTLAICFSMRFVWFAVCYTLRPWHDLPFTEGALANWWIWALGALAVEAYLGVVTLPKWTSSKILITLSLLTAGFLNFGMFAFHINSFSRITVLLEPFVWGIGFFALVNSLMRYEGKWTSRLVNVTAFVGLFSYSLYLTHEFVLGTTAIYTGIVSLLLAMVFAYIFFLLFERPFLSKTSARLEPAFGTHQE